MRKLLFLLLFACSALSFAQGGNDSMNQVINLPWQLGPTVGKISTQATIAIPEGYAFLDAQSTRRFLELNGNPPKDNHYVIAPKTLLWFAVFHFNPSGYIKDDEKIDAAAILKNLQDSDGPTNEERRRLGMVQMYTDGWAVAPHYDPATKHLEWGVRVRTENGQLLTNYTSRLLGRTGVMTTILVSGVETLAADTAEFKRVLTKFDYVAGEKYSEFKQGDKIAEYGLAALIAGGAAAVATKKGFWAVLGGFLAAGWKFIAAAAVAALAYFARLFKRKGSEGK